MTEPITGAFDVSTLTNPGALRADPLDASGPDRFVFFATLLLGVAFLSSVFMTDESPLDEREAKVARIELVLEESAGKADRFEPYRQSERDAASLVASFEISKTGPWRRRVERAHADGLAPKAPTGLRVELAEGDVAELTWDEADGIDGVRVYRSMQEDEGAVLVTDRPVIGTRWTEKLGVLSGAYTYQLQAVRGSEESPLSESQELRFQLPFDWEIAAVSPDGSESVQIRVTPRNRRIPSSVLHAEAGDELTGTGLRIVSITRSSETRREVRSVPVFAPDGTRARDADGKPLSRKMERSIDVPITLVTAEPTRGGAPISRRFVLR